MGNLRDKGYPQAKTSNDRSAKRNAVMTNNTPYMSMGLPNQIDSRTYSQPTALDKLVTAYNNRAFANPNAPLINSFKDDYVDNNDSRALYSGLDLRSRDNNRLAFANKVVDSNGTNYNAGIDNLYFLGGGTFDKEFNTPVGTFGVGYDGDGTAYGSYQSPYYLQALVNLMNRGSL